MTLFVFGINHTTAPIDVREKLAFAPEIAAPALQQILAQTAISEVAILSTCNRTEIYGRLPEDSALAADPKQTVAAWLAGYHDVDLYQVQRHCYFQEQDQAVRHMMRVACGLDSMVLGEPQILGQLKSSFSVARQEKTASSHLLRLFQSAFNTAKQVRTHTAIGENPVSVAFAAVAMARQIFAQLSDQTALLIGAGETIELVARHLRDAGVKRIVVANRTLARAQDLALEFDAKAVLLADIPDYLAQADIVISSTASQLPILGKGAVERVLKQRKHKLMFMVDIAVPRDIEAEVGDLDDVYLYTVDDLKDVIDEGMRSRQEAAVAAEVMIDAGLAAYLEHERSLDAVTTIRDYRQRMEALRDDELNRALVLLAKGEAPQAVLQRLARGLTNKMMHAPTVQLKKASAMGDDQSLELLQTMFELNKTL
ncbi:MAG TPA: glutamyl-tRNA reductase [Oceanospirillaceae bacterium]|nr:glutamyl-tRNA reductase [Oceanospirillaceae bacterium]